MSLLEHIRELRNYQKLIGYYDKYVISNQPKVIKIDKPINMLKDVYYYNSSQKGAHRSKYASLKIVNYQPCDSLRRATRKLKRQVKK